MFQIDLNFYGPYRSVWTLQSALSNSGHSRAIYMARHPNITAIARAKGLEGLSVDEELNKEKCGVAYIGITAASDLGKRFGKRDNPASHHHKIGPSNFADLNISDLEGGQLTDFWAGYFHRGASNPVEGRRHESRLLIAEDVLISWFLPPLNYSGVRRRGVKEEYGSGSFAAATLNFHWWSPGNGETTEDRPKNGLPGFPKSITYLPNAPEMQRLTAYY